MIKLLKKALIWLFAAAMLAASPAGAVTIHQRAVLLSAPPAWVFREYPSGAAQHVTAAADFSKGLYWVKGVGYSNISKALSVSRASPELAQWADGYWSSFPANTLAVTDLGGQMYGAATNDALWARDMSQAAWALVGATSVLTATGIDNAANSASTITATAPNATILQTITLASSSDVFSIFLKRVSGTGTVNITENGGVSWTPVTLTTSWQRFSVTATLANPVVGIQIVTSGGVVAADFAQLELTVLTPPILTTSAPASRAADIITLTGPAASAALAAKGAFFQTNAVAGVGSGARLLQFGGAALFSYTSTTNLFTTNGTNSFNTAFGSGSVATISKVALGLLSSMSAIVNAGATGSAAFAWSGNTGNVILGNDPTGIRPLNGRMESFAFFNTNATAFAGITTP